MDENIQFLVDDGSILDVDENGNIQFDWPVFKSLHFELAKSMWFDHMAEVDKALFSLADKGLVNLEVEIAENGEFELVVSLTDFGRELQEELKNR